MSKKQTLRNPGKTKPDPGAAPGVDPKNVSVVREIAEEDRPDDFESLFGADGGDEQVIVELRRSLPEYIIDHRGQNIPMKGFLENLPGGLTSYYSYIKDKYGGGTFQAHRKVNNRYQGGKQIQIAGSARLPIDESHNAPGPVAIAADDDKIDGVPIGGSDSDFRKRLDRIAEIKATMKMINATGDGNADTNKQILELNQQLIGIVLKNAQGTNPLDQMSTMADMIKIARELGGSDGSVGAGWPDIMKEALGTVGKMITAGEDRRNVKPGQPGQLPAAETENTNQEGKDLSMDMQQIAGTAIVNIVASFRLNKSPEKVVRMLDAMMPITKEDRVKLGKYREAAFDLAEAQALDAIDDFDGALQEKFKVYFNGVFDLFTDAERIPFSFDGVDV